jgi:solute carrier family 35 protein E2
MSNVPARARSSILYSPPHADVASPSHARIERDTPAAAGAAGAAGETPKSRPQAVRIAFFMACWYVCSGVTLFGNKYIMSTLGTDPNILAASQMIWTAAFGAAKMYGPATLGVGRAQPTPLSSQSAREFALDMVLVGAMRFATIVLGLVSLKYVAVSFTETVKSSAPFFTVIFARAMLGERTSLMVNLSLVPVVGGLALCSATELSFNFVGFFAAVANNCIDCVQNVFSKKLLSTHYNYVNLQFYTSAAALVIQLPLMLWSHAGAWWRLEARPDAHLALCLLLNGATFHAQSVSAYAVMGLISPVTQSVANTLKRALLIWLSVLIFGNPMTALSGLGTVVCIGGVLAYNHARRRYPAAPSEPPHGKRLEPSTPDGGGATPAEQTPLCRAV